MSGRGPGARVKVLRIAAVAAGLAIWFETQALLGARALPASTPDAPVIAGDLLSAGDGLFALTAPWHRWLADHPGAADALLIASSLCIDALGLFVLGRAIAGPTFRPFVGLLCIFALRQVCQALCPLPAPSGMIWRDPGFPSLLVTYGVGNDFFFSGHTALGVYGAVELGRIGGRATKALAVALGLFLIAVVLCLRAHYTMDIFCGAVVALWIAAIADALARPVDRVLARLGGDRVREK